MVPTRPSICWPALIRLLRVPYQPYLAGSDTIESGFYIFMPTSANLALHLVPTRPSICWPAWLGLHWVPYQPDLTGYVIIALGSCILMPHYANLYYRFHKPGIPYGGCCMIQQRCKKSMQLLCIFQMASGEANNLQLQLWENMYYVHP